MSFANDESGASIRTKINSVLNASAARRVLGVSNGDISPFTARFLTEIELRDVIGIFAAGNKGLVPDPISVTGKVLLDSGWGSAVSAVSEINPVTDSAPYSVVPFTIATNTSNEHRFFIGAQNQNIHFPQSLSVDPAANGMLTAPPLHTLSIRAAVGVSINGVAGNGTTAPIGGNIIWTVPATGTVEWLVRDINTIVLRGAIAGAPLDAAKNAISNYRQAVKRVTSSALLTLDATTYPGGCTVIYTATGTSLVLPSRLAAGETAVSEAIVFHHRGSSGTLTISTTGGVVPIGDTTIPSSRSATIEWDRDATTQFVTVRTTG